MPTPEPRKPFVKVVPHDPAVCALNNHGRCWSEDRIAFAVYAHRDAPHPHRTMHVFINAMAWARGLHRRPLKESR